MDEHARGETKPQATEPERRGPEVRDTKRDALSRSVSLLNAGIRLMDIPAEELLGLASRIGNSNLLELLTPRSGIGAAGPIPEPSASDVHKAPNRITAGPIELTAPFEATGSGTMLRSFPVNRLVSRADNGAGGFPMIPAGMNDGAISD